MSPFVRRLTFVASGIGVAALIYFWNTGRATPETEAPRIAARPKGAGPSPNKWRLANESERQLLASTIRAQLDAFKRDDWDMALTYQSEELKKNFSSSEQFRRVIEESYPQFANYRKVDIGVVRIGGAWALVELKLTGEDGVQVKASYQLVRENGDYKVAGVSGGFRRRSNPQVPRDLV